MSVRVATFEDAFGVLAESLERISERLEGIGHALGGEAPLRGHAHFRGNASMLVVEPPAGQVSIYVCNYTLVADGAVNVQWAGGSTNDPRTFIGTGAEAGRVSLAANGGQSPSSTWPDYLFSTDPGEGLVLVLFSAVQVGGHVGYVIAPPAI